LTVIPIRLDIRGVKPVRSGRTSVRLADRSRIVLLAALGPQNKEIAERLGIGRVQVARGRQRCLDSGIQVLIPAKDIWLYPLRKNFAAVLCQ
jgi:hypothetical protein